MIGGDVTGIAVNVTARIATAAQGGEVLASATVRDLVAGSEIALADRGLHHLKGIPGMRPLVAVDVAADGAPGRVLNRRRTTRRRPLRALTAPPGRRA